MKYRFYFSGYLNGKLLIHTGDWTTYARAVGDRIMWEPITEQLEELFIWVEPEKPEWGTRALTSRSCDSTLEGDDYRWIPTG